MDFIDHLYATITITNGDSRKLYIFALVVFHSVSFSLTLFFPSQTDSSLPLSLHAFSFFLLPLLQPQPLFLSLQLSCFFSQSLKDIFITLSVSFPSYLRILTSQRLRVLFRLSFAQLMWQRLGKKPLFNAEVKDLLSSCAFQKFPVVTNISWRLYTNYLCSRKASAFLFHGSRLTMVSNSIFNMMTQLSTLSRIVSF